MKYAACLRRLLPTTFYLLPTLRESLAYSRLKPLRPVSHFQLFDKLVQPPIDDFAEVVQRESDPVIRDSVLRKVVRPNLVAPVTALDHLFPLGGNVTHL